ITSAALLLVVVIGAFATSGIVFIKMIGVGMIIAILVDATIVRALLVPATMRLLGRRNWWAPAPLARFWARWGLRERADEPAAVASPRSRDQQQAVSSL
ncbi:MAG: trehalose monomycolate/heme transporter, partial [Actinomycetota bacterium]|nr:trehalose monomycolate/heme transporter [Actinomycetota bacterium]